MNNFLTYLNNPIIIGAIGLGALYLCFQLFRRLFSLLKRFKPKNTRLSFSFRFKRNPYEKIVKQFKSKLPFIVRLTLQRHQKYLYINTANDELVQGLTDYKRYSYHFYPEYKQHADMGLYLTSKYLITELKNESLHDNSKENNQLITKSWRPIIKDQIPITLVSIDAKLLFSEDPTAIETLCDSIRNKINIIAYSKRKSIPVCLVIANLHQIPGFKEFNEVLEHLRINNYILFDKEVDLEKLQRFVELVSAKHLNFMLNSSRPERYLDIIHFIKNFENALPLLTEAIRIITYNDEVLPAPTLLGLFLTNYNEKSIGNLFPLFDQQRKYYQNPKTKITAIATAAVIAATSVSAYKNLSLASTYTTSAALINQTQSTPQATVIAYGRLLDNLKSQYQADSWLHLFPASLAKNKVHQEIANDLYSRFILPALTNTNNSNVLFYSLFITEVQHNSALAKNIENNLNLWSNVTGIPASVIHLYIKFNKQSRIKSLNEIQFNSDLLKTSGPSDTLRYSYFKQMLNYFTSTPESDLSQLRHFQQEVSRPLLKTQTDCYLLSQIWPNMRDNFAKNVQDFVKSYMSAEGNICNQTASPSQKLMTVAEAISQTDLTTRPPTQGLSSLVSRLSQQVSQYQDRKHVNNLTLQQWSTVVRNAEISQTISQFINHNNTLNPDQIIFGSQNAFAPVELNQLNAGKFIITGQYQIPGNYTAIAFKTTLEPVLAQYQLLVNRLNAAGVPTIGLQEFIASTLNSYAANYLNYYSNLFNSFSYKIHSISDLKLLLMELTTINSPLRHLISVVNANTTLPTKAQLSFMLPVVSHFNKLHSLLSTNGVANSNYDAYTMILNGIYQSILQNANLNANNGYLNINDVSSNLSKQLSAIGRMSLDIYTGDTNSYLKITQNWLKNVGIPDDLAPLFKKPILALYNLGIQQVQTQLISVWNQQLTPMLYTLASKFPFSSDSSKNVDINELTAKIGPNGQFWALFNQNFKPFLVANGDQWTTRHIDYGSIIIPSNILHTINAVSHLRNTLWNEQGEPQAIHYQVLADQLPTLMVNNQNIILSYLTLGTNDVYGINSKPIWKALDYKWWTPQPTSVGLETAVSKYHSYDVFDANWGLFNILNKGYSQDGQTWSWSLPVGPSVVNIHFKFKTNPWKLFHITNEKRK
ncbi:type VI secretion system membrane subunit TssM [Piscirickettsia litoralis]|uniref:Type VI secretion protein IcmF n=1 Tax=Piscirickettsia litoralis TaxID=1891921 RepID=A0ABX3A041_9GAMM|nr:hypothetical protein [Piscirickettsia litoralis]ODN42222.1 hypothetical protein BGC07_03815 [Piscirickettsia litoralis]